jgi:hypothetical protein
LISQITATPLVLSSIEIGPHSANGTNAIGGERFRHRNSQQDLSSRSGRLRRARLIFEQIPPYFSVVSQNQDCELLQSKAKGEAAGRDLQGENKFWQRRT